MRWRFCSTPQWQIGLFPSKPLKLQTLTDFGNTFFSPFERIDLCKNPCDSLLNWSCQTVHFEVKSSIFHWTLSLQKRTVLSLIVWMELPSGTLCLPLFLMLWMTRHDLSQMVTCYERYLIWYTELDDVRNAARARFTLKWTRFFGSRCDLMLKVKGDHTVLQNVKKPF